MDERDARRTEPPGAAALTGPRAGQLLETVLDTVHADLRDWRVRSVHRRGTSSVAVVYEVDLVDARGRPRDRLFVGHATTRRAPGGAAELDVDGARIHVWQFPHDPYLPGLPDAVHRPTAAALLRRLGLADAAEGTRSTAIRTRSYRPTRRAVVALGPSSAADPVAYVKLCGGRDTDRIRRRTRRLRRVHDVLAEVVPVPRVLEHDEDDGRVVLGALPGDRLRTVLRTGDRMPEPAQLRDLVDELARGPALPDGADPDAYADVGRHVVRLRRRLPERAADLERVAAVAAGVAGPRATVHGDLHDGQLLVVDGAVSGVLDIDGAGTGHVAHDLGRLLAHLEASALAVPEAADRVTAYVDEVREAVVDIAPPRDVAAATAGAWLGLATGPLRVASPTWEADVTARIDRALWWARAADRHNVTHVRGASGGT